MVCILVSGMSTNCLFIRCLCRQCGGSINTMKDVSNIFKLLPDELEKKCSSRKKLWDDTAPEIAEFAGKLQELLKVVDTPYVLGLDGAYGTGKTHFATRFAAQMQPEIRTIYFSAWEKDYIKEPLNFFVEEISWLIKKEPASFLDNNIKLVKDLLQSLWLATESVSVAFGIPGFQIGCDISVRKFRKQLNSLKLSKDILQKAKSNLTEYIKLLPGSKLVFIVDDLDRCRPDVAVKLLEVIKHFFDIEGLIVIMPINQIRLKLYIDAFYGIPVGAKEQLALQEDYLRKFFNDIINIPKLNYQKICADKITKKEFSKNLTYVGDNYNSISELQKWVAEYAKESKFSYRETVQIIKRAKLFCNNYNEPIRCRLLAYTLCNCSQKQKTNSWNRGADIGYGDNNIYAVSQQNPKTLAFKRTPAYHPLASIRNRFSVHCRFRIDAYITAAGHVYDTYDGTYNNIDHLIRLISEISEDNFSNKGLFNNYIKPILAPIIPDLEAQRTELQNLQAKHGSDDNDLKRAKDYEEKIQNLYLLK